MGRGPGVSPAAPMPTVPSPSRAPGASGSGRRGCAVPCGGTAVPWLWCVGASRLLPCEAGSSNLETASAWHPLVPWEGPRAEGRTPLPWLLVPPDWGALQRASTHGSFVWQSRCPGTWPHGARASTRRGRGWLQRGRVGGSQGCVLWGCAAHPVPGPRCRPGPPACPRGLCPHVPLELWIPRSGTSGGG